MLQELTIGLKEGKGGKSFFCDGLEMSVGKGDKMNFWEDLWVGNMALKVVYPMLYW